MKKLSLSVFRTKIEEVQLPSSIVKFDFYIKLSIASKQKFGKDCKQMAAISAMMKQSCSRQMITSTRFLSVNPLHARNAFMRLSMYTHCTQETHVCVFIFAFASQMVL